MAYNSTNGNAKTQNALRDILSTKIIIEKSKILRRVVGNTPPLSANFEIINKRSRLNAPKKIRNKSSFEIEERIRSNILCTISLSKFILKRSNTNTLNEL